MKRLLLMAAAAGAMVLAACGGKKSQDNNIITTDYEAPAPKAPIAMSGQSRVKAVEWNGGHQYTISIVRTPADSLPMVADDIGQQYIDNAVRVEVLRADSSVFYRHAFTKRDFADLTSHDYREKALLEEINFLQADERELVFMAWLNHPDAGDDEALGLRLAIDKSGKASIQEYDGEDDRDDLSQQEED